MKMKENKFFEISDLKEELNDNKIFSDSFDREMCYKVESLKNLTCHLPGDGQIFFIETLKSFTAFNFVHYILKETGHINNLYIATYSTNDRIINALLKYHDKGLVDKVHFHISETIKFRMPEIYDRLIELQQYDFFNLTFAWSHKKVTGVETPVGCYVVEGSGNYGENAMEEQYVFLKSKLVYEFRTGHKSTVG